MDKLVAEEYVNHHPPPFPGLPTGREGLKQAFKIFWEATPGHHEIEDQIAEGDKVVTRLTAYGRHEGELPGPIPPTGKEIHMPAVAIHRIANGKLVEHWSGTDELGLLVQLGSSPFRSPGTSPRRSPTGSGQHLGNAPHGLQTNSAGANLAQQRLPGSSVLFERTVDHHVVSILRKLGVRTRGEASAEAARLGLHAKPR